MKPAHAAVSILAVFTLSTSVDAEVTDRSAMGFTSQHTLVLAGTPEQAWDALVHGVAQWWDADHSYSGEAAAFQIDARAGGCFCERSADIAVEHLRVVRVIPGRVLLMQGGLGPLQNMAVTGSMSFVFEPHAEGSMLTYRYVVGGYTANGLEDLAEPVDRVQLGQLQRLASFIATGEPRNSAAER